MDNELILFDRVNVIRDVIRKHGEDKFYISFSGGKDSTVLHHLVDEAIPGNRIDRVYVDTGIEYQMIRDFVFKMAETDDRIKVIKPGINIKEMFEKVGYPFKSKEHSLYLSVYQNSGTGGVTVKRYLSKDQMMKPCPKILRYQFTPEFNIKISDRCCTETKKKPFHVYEKKSGRTIAMTGMMNAEGGIRATIPTCIIADKNGNVKKFHPLLKVDKEWEEWYINSKQIQLCDLYYPPYNFERTGCKGCPFSLNLQKDLETMALLLPNERKQCEMIWKPVYDEYRRIGFRLNKNERMRLL